MIHLPSKAFSYTISRVRSSSDLWLWGLFAVWAFFFSFIAFPLSASAHANLEGVTGILNVPSAESLEDGEVFFGYGYNTNRDRFFGARQRNYFAGVGYLPGLEVCARYIEFPEIPEQQVPGFGTRKDRSVNIKYQFVCESCHKISLAVGVYDVGGKARVESAKYLTATKTIGPAKLTLGFGTDRLSGVFGGAEIKLSDKFSLLYENDRLDNNFGIRITPSKHVALLLGSVNENFSFGLSYLKDLVPPKFAEKPVEPSVKASPISEKADEEALKGMALELKKLGYENIEVKLSGPELTVKYENRLSRLEEEAWAKVLLWSAIRAPAEVETMRVVSRREGELVLVTKFTRDELLRFVNGEIDASEFAKELTIFDYEDPGYDFTYETGLVNPSSGTTDVFMSPAVKLSLGEPFEPLKHRSGFSISHDTSVAGGMTLTGALEIPVVNNLDARDAPFVKAEALNFFDVASGGRYFLASAGYFGEHVYGAKGEIRQYFQQSLFDLGVEGAYAKDKFYDRTEKELLFSATWRHPLYGLYLRGYTGKFLRGDQGWLFETKRYLGKHEIAFFVYDTDAISTEAGFRYTVPLVGYNDTHYSRMRFGVAPLYSYEYRTTNLLAGQFLAPRTSVEDFRRRLYPFYLRENIDILRKSAGGR